MSCICGGADHGPGCGVPVPSTSGYILAVTGVGAPGSKGDKGDPGLDGQSVTYVGTVLRFEDLPASANAGDMWWVETPSPTTAFIWDDILGLFVAAGRVQGDAGADSMVPGPAGAPGAPGRDGVDGKDGATGARGPKGDTGDTGATGPTGPQGNVGAPGAQGAVGPIGPTGPAGGVGPQGEPGPAGASGSAGAPGPVGPAGSVGPQGIPGIQGPAGLGITYKSTVATVDDLPATAAQGDLYVVETPEPAHGWVWDAEYSAWVDAGPVQGPQGVPGPVGPAGPAGEVGATGADGAPGVAGPAGPMGPQGEVGSAGPAGADSTVPGPAGPAGPVGAQGDPGSVGPAGEIGPAGPQGEVGPAGPQGEPGVGTGVPGPDGPAGPAGADGAPGRDGVDGVPGAQGDPGPVGPAGPTGADGATGPAGSAGADGPVGPKGDQGVQGEPGVQGEQGIQGIPGLGITFKGSVPTVADLPATATQGDLYIVESPVPAHSWVWDDTAAAFIDGGVMQGPQGVAGPQGIPGEQGLAGNDGAVGPAGPKGDTGPAGPKGDPGDPASVTGFLPLTGGTLTGTLTLPSGQVGLAINGTNYSMLAGSGGVAWRNGTSNIINFTGAEIVNYVPMTTPATGVGVRFGSGGPSLSKSGTSIASSAPITVAAAPTGANELANKAYVDSVAGTGGGGTSYTLPPATATVLGGVKQGSGVTIAADGTLSAAAGVTNPVAGSVAGMVIWTGTQSQYDALTKNATTVYFITA